jgi:hypothetical protein
MKNKQTKKKKRRNSLLVNLLIVVLIIVAIAFLIYQGTLTGHILLTDIDPDSSFENVSYAPPYDVFNNNETILLLDNEEINIYGKTEIDLIVTVNHPGALIWKYAYYREYNATNDSNSKWIKFEFPQNTLEGEAENWTTSFAEKQLSIPVSSLREGAENLIAAYSCKKQEGEWACGCDNPTQEKPCMEYMLQIYEIVDSETPGGPGTEGCNVNADCTEIPQNGGCYHESLTCQDCGYGSCEYENLCYKEGEEDGTNRICKSGTWLMADEVSYYVYEEGEGVPYATGVYLYDDSADCAGDLNYRLQDTTDSCLSRFGNEWRLFHLNPGPFEIVSWSKDRIEAIGTYTPSDNHMNLVHHEAYVEIANLCNDNDHCMAPRGCGSFDFVGAFFGRCIACAPPNCLDEDYCYLNGEWTLAGQQCINGVFEWVGE